MVIGTLVLGYIWMIWYSVNTRGREGTRVFFRIWNMGGVNNPRGYIPFPSLPFPFPIPSLPLSLSFPPEAGGCYAKVGRGYYLCFSSVWSLARLSVCQDYSNEQFFDIFVAVRS